ncbi:MAG: electron transfer flavoprotein subunit alpha/FixB family protein [Lachnospiraceae bacterium]
MNNGRHHRTRCSVRRWGTIRPAPSSASRRPQGSTWRLIEEGRSLLPGGRRYAPGSLGFVSDAFEARLDIAGCETIVCVGAGLKNESLPKYRELAALLGGKLACTRPLVDRELLPYKLQVGQSGVMIKPRLYIGFGISGAVNHVTGVDAETFIAVNSDPNAAIFNYCDYGIVADMDEVCDAMIARLKAR